MPNSMMENLSADANDKDIQDAISEEMSICMKEPGAEPKACAGRAYGMARNKTGKALNIGK